MLYSTAIMLPNMDQVFSRTLIQHHSSFGNQEPTVLKETYGKVIFFDI